MGELVVDFFAELFEREVFGGDLEVASEGFVALLEGKGTFSIEKEDEGEVFEGLVGKEDGQFAQDAC